MYMSHIIHMVIDRDKKTIYRQGKRTLQDHPRSVEGV
jgi:hypothetical protein